MELTLKRKDKAAGTAPFTPSQPRVNLVPQSSLDRTANARDRRLSIIAWVGSVLALGAWWGSGHLENSGVRADLADATSQGQKLAQDLALYAPVTTIAVQTKSLTDTVSAQTATEVDHAQVITRFLAAVSGTMNVQTVQVNTDNSTACVSTDPFNKVPLAGCITFTGTAVGGGGGASGVITALATDTWFADPFIPTVGDAQNSQSPVSGTVGLTVESQEQAPATGTGK
jgi:hypothetical protein